MNPRTIPIMLNLVPIDRIERRRRNKRVVMWAMPIGVYALLIGVAAVVVHGPAARSLQEVRSAARQATTEADLATAKREETMRTVANKLRVLEASRTVGQHPDWSVLLSAISTIRGDSIVLTGLELADTGPESDRSARTARIDSGTAVRAGSVAATTAAGRTSATPVSHGPERNDSFKLRIVGMGLSHSDVMGFVGRLEGLGPLRNVTVVDARTGKFGAGELTNFELTCQLADQSAGSLPTHSGASSGAAGGGAR